jgi:leucyl/phenylalanyl-tRNA---protein transferase
VPIDLPWLEPDPDAPFPPVERALREPPGLLAVGGDLSVPRLLNAYRHGIFPWFSKGQPPLWWCPDPRAVFRTDAVHLSRRFRRQVRASQWVVCADTAFGRVVSACAETSRPGQPGTWITDDMRAAYTGLHRAGHAHSVEVFDGPRLVGGLYGVAIGRMFFGESMFSGESGGSKVALAGLAHRLRQWGWPLIDAQLPNPHLDRMGAETWSRARFLTDLARLVRMPDGAGPWRSRFGAWPASDLLP